MAAVSHTLTCWRVVFWLRRADPLRFEGFLYLHRAARRIVLLDDSGYVLESRFVRPGESVLSGMEIDLLDNRVHVGPQETLPPSSDLQLPTLTDNNNQEGEMAVETAIELAAAMSRILQGDGGHSSVEELPLDLQTGSMASSPADSDPTPFELYGNFTWRIDNFSQIKKRTLESPTFHIGGYEWYILMYPQGCELSDSLSVFLSVANDDKLLSGWTRSAQFTIALVNRDPKKSKYSDTLHIFRKEEHDWGWKNYLELLKLHDGFLTEDALTIKAQVQVIREKEDRPFRCLEDQYRRELVKVYFSNVEQICERFIDEKRSKLRRLIEDAPGWSSFIAFWFGMHPFVRRFWTRESTDVILNVLVKHFFIVNDVTSTLVMESLYSGLKALEYQSKTRKGLSRPTETDAESTPLVLIDQDTFVLADDVILLPERAILDANNSPNSAKDRDQGDRFNEDSVERDDRRLEEHGQKTLEFFVLDHIFSRIYQEMVASKREDELIHEEEVAGLAEIDI